MKKSKSGRPIALKNIKGFNLPDGRHRKPKEYMDRSSLLENLNQLVKLWNQHVEPYNALDRMVCLLEEYIKDHPCDVELLFKMGLTKYTPPKASSAGAQLFFEKVLSCDSNNIKAFLALAFVGYDTDRDGKILQRLKTVKTNDVQEQAPSLVCSILFLQKRI